MDTSIAGWKLLAILITCKLGGILSGALSFITLDTKVHIDQKVGPRLCLVQVGAGYLRGVVGALGMVAPVHGAWGWPGTKRAPGLTPLRQGGVQNNSRVWSVEMTFR